MNPDSNRQQFISNQYFSQDDPAAFAYFQQELMAHNLQNPSSQPQQIVPVSNTASAQYWQYQQQSNQRQSQQQYRPSIMVPPQSPTLASYYFENGWVNHYYDPKRRQYLSSRVDPEFHKQQYQLHAQQRQDSTQILPTPNTLDYSQQHFQLAAEQQLLQSQNYAASHNVLPQPSNSAHLLPNYNQRVNNKPIASRHHTLQQPHDVNHLLQQGAGYSSMHNAVPMQPLSANLTVPAASNHYLSAAAGAAAAAASSGISQPAVLSQMVHQFASAEWTEEWRENLLQYAHTLYSTSPQNPMLLSLLHSLHEAFPSHLPTLLLLACVYYSYQDYQSSLRYNHLILKYDPNYVEAMSNIGTTLRSMGRTAEAERWWYQAVKLRPGYWDAVENLVGVLCSTIAGATMALQQDISKTAIEDGSTKNRSTDQQQTCPRYKEALVVCEFVEQYFFSQNDYERDSPVKRPRHLPVHQLPRLQNLFYAKGNLKYALGDVVGARRDYEKGLELAFGGTSLLAVANHVALACGSTAAMEAKRFSKMLDAPSLPLVLLQPEKAIRLHQVAFASTGGVLPGLIGHGNTQITSSNDSTQQANQTTSTILLTLAKLFQDLMNPSSPALAAAATVEGRSMPTLGLLLPLYYLSLALHPSPSTANNLGIILSNIPGAAAMIAVKLPSGVPQQQQLTGTMLAMQYYMYGLQLDPRHPHLYTNLGSLLKDMGHLNEAVAMYEKAVECNPRFDVALANLGNAIKDMGRVQDSVQWYRRAVEINPNFVDAVCGLVNSLGGVCDWRGRGGVSDDGTVDEYGNYFPATGDKNAKSGWIGRVVEIVEKQLDEGAGWGSGILKHNVSQRNQTLGESLVEFMISTLTDNTGSDAMLAESWRKRLAYFAENATKKKNEGGWLIRLIERIMRRLQRKWYIELYGATVQSSTRYPPVQVLPEAARKYQRPLIPSTLSAPPVPTVLPFHTFTYPLDTRQVRLISHRNALRISHTTLTSSWVAPHVYPPPPPPSSRLKIGYVSSDFNNHPLSHLMQSVFGFHDRTRFEIFCYATTPSDNSPYRQKIEREVEHFLDVSSWAHQQVIERIVNDGIHVLINLNGYTKGARNEIFAARPSPVQCSFMGFAGTLGGGWCDWIIADSIVCPPEMVSCEIWRQRHQKGQEFGGDFEGDIDPEEDTNDFEYTEKFIYMPHSYFVNDHKQGFREDHGHGKNNRLALETDPKKLWSIEEDKRWKMRREVFPNLPDDVVIFANFNQLYKLEPSTFRMWLRILERVPNSILWLLRFPPAGEQHLIRCAVEWAGPQVAQRVMFTDVAPKHIHIHRGRVADLFLDTPECNAHTTAADILWSGTPIVTFPKYVHKMCSRVGASIALATGYGDEMVVTSEQHYEARAVELAQDLVYEYHTSLNGEVQRRGKGSLIDLRKRLFCSREQSRLFDTLRWTRNLERGYTEAWRRWVTAEEFEDYQQDVSKPGCIWVVDPDD
ncbi:hypothetical protein DFQ28_008884 [Apophysomyces sp. BC1034]|nr:hypothetical protein DFQ30_005230 [Apophysomyces sp. BC1015]KAG0183395.1 hypothetical protein DFQ29_005771 [Apophysomyces sp. BC1021]KAG0194625.1 hypothetical protein DFQ28_008884 [Apophysomyces sp. BC1034]